MSRSSRRAFTFTDLMVSIAIGLILLVLILPASFQRLGSRSAIIKCSSNLKQIGLAIKMYANDEVRNGNAYPRTRYDKSALPVVGTSNPRGWNDDNASFNKMNADSFVPGNGAPDPNDVTGAMFLILRTQEITTDTFLCPSSTQDRWTFDAPTETVQFYTNWTAGSTQRRSIGKALSYSYSNPYGNMQAISKGFLFSDNMPGDVALMSDINPGTPELLTTSVSAPRSAIQKINSPNHDYDGQNVLYADGHVDWATTPFAGAGKDNIFTARTSSGDPANGFALIPAAGTMLSPVDGSDSVLLPTWDPSTPLPKPSLLGSVGGFEMLILVGVAAGIIAVIVVVIVIFVLPKRRPPTPPPPMNGPGMPPPVMMG